VSTVLHQAIANALVYAEYCRQTRNREFCRCKLPFKRDTLAAFAPPEIAVEREPLPADAYALFCGECGKARALPFDFVPDPNFKP
jgi:hypothetical protein